MLRGGARKRQCRRRVVSTTTVSRVPAETWVVICANLYFSPHTVFRLMMACKHLWTTLSKDDAWWNTFMLRVIRYQECLSHSNIHHSLTQLTGRLGYGPSQAVQLVCSQRCSTCGARFGHFIFRPLRRRVCAHCLQAALVSNRVLALRYGIDVADCIMAYVGGGGTLMPLDYYQHRSRMSQMARLTLDPVDYVGRTPIMFLVRADVERVLGVRLEPDAVVAQRASVAAAWRLAACVRRSHALLRLRAAAVTSHLRAHRVRNALLELANNELQRTLSPIAIPDGFVLGGAVCASGSCAGRASQRRRPHLTADEANAASRCMYAPLGYSVNASANMWI